jgi:hypothetical protein
MSTETRLRELGDELEQLFANDLRAEPRLTQTARRRAGRRSWLATRRRRWLAAATVLVVGVPGVAYATGAFTSPRIVARSLPAGARIFGSTPTCTTVRANVEYRCTLRTAPPPDPVQHLTARQWNTLLGTPPNLGKLTFVKRREEIAPGEWRTVQMVKDPARLERITRAYRNKVLAGFGFTPAQIKAHNDAVDAGAAGIEAGHFRGTVEPTVNATHHVNGGCRATSADGSRWECYIGHTAVRQKIVSQGFLGQYVAGPGVG